MDKAAARGMPHLDRMPRAGRGSGPTGFISVAGNIGDVAAARAAMGIDWMNRKGLSQAIPPAYAEFIGRQIMAALGGHDGSSRQSHPVVESEDGKAADRRMHRLSRREGDPRLQDVPVVLRLLQSQRSALDP